MGDLLVASRKGLLHFAETPRGFALAQVAFEGDPVSSVLADPRDGAWLAALNLGHFGVKLHRSEDRGRNWRELAAPAFAADPAADAAAGDAAGKADAKAPSVSLIWTLVAAGPAPGTLWAGTIPGGLFRSEDGGATWALNAPLWNEPKRREWMGGGYDDPGIHTIVVDPRQPKRVTVGVSTGGVWRSATGGAGWQLAGQGLRAAYMPPARANDPAVQDVHRLSACAAAPDVLWCQHHNGIFRSEDGGERFRELVAQPSSFGFAVAAHPADPRTAWFVPAVKDERRYPVERRFVVTRTRDGGASFETLTDGLPPPPAYDLVYRHGLDVEATGERLAMGSTTGGLWVGEKGGARWSLVSAHLPPIYQVAWLPAG